MYMIWELKKCNRKSTTGVKTFIYTTKRTSIFSFYFLIFQSSECVHRVGHRIGHGKTKVYKMKSYRVVRLETEKRKPFPRLYGPITFSKKEFQNRVGNRTTLQNSQLRVGRKT